MVIYFNSLQNLNKKNCKKRNYLSSKLILLLSSSIISNDNFINHQHFIKEYILSTNKHGINWIIDDGKDDDGRFRMDDGRM